MNLNPSSLGFRAGIASTLILALCILLMYWAMSSGTRFAQTRSSERELTNVVAALGISRQGPLQAVVQHGPDAPEADALRELTREGFSLVVLRTSGSKPASPELQYAFSTGPNGDSNELIGRQFKPNTLQLQALAGETVLPKETASPNAARIALAPIKNQAGEIIGLLELSSSAVHRFTIMLHTFSTLMILALGAGVMVWINSRIMTPLAELMRVFDQTETKALDEEQWESRGQEVGQISRALNRVRGDTIELGFNPRHMLEAGSGILITCDKKGLIEYASPSLDILLSMPNRDIVGIKLDYFVSPDQEDEMETIWDRLHQNEPWSGNLKLISPNQPDIWTRVAIAPMHNAEGEIARFVASVTDINDLIEAQYRLENLALYEQLTGLPNRQLLHDRLEHALAELSRREDMLAVFYIDLDRFKRINDTFGHELGDQVIQEISARLKSNLRKEDTIASLGGDEFVLISMGLKNENSASAIVRKLTANLSRPISISNYDIVITASIGISVAPNDGASSKELLKNADMAMYEAKKSGRNNFQFFTEELNYAAIQRMYLETEIRRSLELEHFLPHYQPQIDLKTGSVFGVEALLRWEHPERGLISPLEFIPVAEDSGQIIKLGAWMLRKSCMDVQKIRTELNVDVQVAVNLSPRQFLDSHLLETVQQALQDSGLPPEKLELELTESSLLENLTEVVKVLKALKDLGVSVGIDDFGTGYSSLGYLKKFPIDLLKVDRSFVRDIPEDPNDCEIATAIIAIARSLRLRVVAEGVETEEQAAFLRDADCDYAQGYLFAKPMSVSDLTEFLETSESPALKT